jgi:hypothetical protein
MNTDLNRGPAEIIPFPSRARTSLGELRDVAKPVAKFPLPRAVKVASGSGWYHEAAIEDADRTFKN